jgi:tetratricopeptide (TPR) repeat protein
MSIPHNFVMKPLPVPLFVLFIITLFLSPFNSRSQDLLPLEEPSWVYKGRGDRFWRNGDTGEAVAEYKKALLKRKQEIILPKLEGIRIEDGLSRIQENLEGKERSDAYGRLLYLFLNNHGKTVTEISSDLEDGRNREARETIISLRNDAHTIGAEQVEAHAAMLEQAIFKRNRELWDSLLSELSESLNVVLEALASLDLVLDDRSSRIRGDRLRFNVERDTPYPEVNLALARIYAEEGLYDLSYKQLNLFDRGKDCLQMPDLILEALYLRAEILLRQDKRDEYERILEEIIVMDENWEGDAKGLRGYVNRPFSQIPDSRIQVLARDVESRGKYGRAYFQVGKQKYLNGSEPGAEPYLIMALLYGYERKETHDLLERYYTMTDQPRNLKKLADIGSLLQYH